MKNINLALTVLFLTVIFVFTAAFILVPDVKFSEQENRNLKTLPTASLEKVADGTYTAEMNEYFADQFVMRNTLVGLKGYVEISLLKGENNGVIVGKNGQLAVRRFNMYKNRLEQTADTDFYYRETVKSYLKNLNRYAESSSIDVTTVLPPRTVDVAASAFNYPATAGDSLNTLIKSTLDEKCGYIDLLSVFRKRYNKGEYVYYKTDHHWTTKGAYIAYCEIMKEWGMEEEIIPESEFTVEKIPSFYGTTWSRAGLKFVKPDTMEIWSRGNEDQFITECLRTVNKRDENGKLTAETELYKSFTGWLNRDYLTKKNKYAAFLDGIHNEQTVFKKGKENRGRLLIAKDSFADSLVPFLVQHFDLVIVNLSNNVSNLTEYARRYNCERVLLVYNFENLTTDSNLGNIN